LSVSLAMNMNLVLAIMLKFWLIIILLNHRCLSSEKGSKMASGDLRFTRKRVLLGVTASVGAMDIPPLTDRLLEAFDVKIITSLHAASFFDTAMIPKNAEIIENDQDWHDWKEIGDPILHIELRNWADILVVAPLTANTLGKFVSGICDNLLTTVFRAWRLDQKPVLVGPSMNLHMWKHPVTERQLDELDSWGVKIVPPRTMLLAGGDFGPAALASTETIASAIVDALE